MVYLTFACEFNAVHRLWNDAAGEKENITVFGECANPSGHGHRYRVEVTVAARVDADNPVVLPRAAIRSIIDDVLSPRLRNGDMNTAFGIDGFISTGENVTKAISRLLRPALGPGVTLDHVRVVETQKNSFAHFAGDRAPGRARPMI